MYGTPWQKQKSKMQSDKRKTTIYLKSEDKNNVQQCQKELNILFLPPKQQWRPLPSLLSLFYTSHANLSHQWCDEKGCFTYRKKDQLAEVLRHALDTSNNKYADIDEEDDFQVRNCCGKSNRSYTHAALTALNIASDMFRKTYPDEIASWQFINKRVS